MGLTEPSGKLGTVVTVALPESIRRIAEAKLSPDGRWLGWMERSALAEATVTLLAIELVGAGETSGVGQPLVVASGCAFPHPDGGGSWSWMGSDAVLVVRDDGALIRRTLGANDQNVEAVLVAATEDRQRWSPASCADGSFVVWTSEANLDVRVEGAWFDPNSNTLGPACLLSSGSPGSFVLDPSVMRDAAGVVSVAWLAWDEPSMPWDLSRIELVRVVDSAGTPKVVAWGVREGGSLAQPHWCGDADLVFLDDSSGWLNATRGVITDHGLPPNAPGNLGVEIIGEHTESFEHGGPAWGPGQRTVAASMDGRWMALERNEGGFGRLCVSHRVLSDGAWTDGVMTAIGKGAHRSLSCATTTTGTRRIAAIRQGATTPPQLVLYESTAESDHWTRSVVRQTTEASDSVRAHGAVEPTLVSWTGRDGQDVHGRIYRPDSVDASTPLRTIVSVHGGPTDQQRVVWNQRYVAYLAAGWQVFVPDFRGSTGWGRAYQQAMNGEWGVRDTHDVLDGIDALVEPGVIDPSCVVLSGGSAGGFTVLHLLIERPTFFAAAVVLYPVTDLAELDATTHRFERHYNRVLVGTPERYVERSPLASAGTIRTPLLLLHGGRDRVVGIGQSVALLDRLFAGSADWPSPAPPIEFVAYPTEGHGWKLAATQHDEHNRVMALLARCAG
jgi:acetyl esterase/lipase